MKKLTKLSRPVKIIGKIILYLAFVAIGINIALSNSNIRTATLIVTVLIVVGNLFYDYLKYLLDKIMFNISNASSTEETWKLVHKLERFDILNGMRQSLIIPKILLDIDSNHPNELLDRLEENTSFLHSKPDYLLIYHYSKFKAYTLNNQTKNALEQYTHLARLKESNFKSKHMNLLFNWDQIEALQLTVLKKYGRAIVRFQEVNRKNYNPREELLYLTELGHCYKKDNRIADLESCVKHIELINPTSAYLKELRG